MLNFEKFKSRFSSQKRKEGPEFQVILAGQNLWIEATVADVGTKTDKVPEPVFGEINKVPEEQMLLRFTNSISEKDFKRQNYLSKGIVKPGDLFVIGINGFLVMKLFETEIPYIVKSVLGFGDYFATTNIETLEIVDNGYKERPNIIKNSQKPVSTSGFAQGEIPGISGVIHSNRDLWNLPASLGNDFIFVHNPTADSPIPQGWMPIGKEFWVEGDKLRVRQHRE